MSDGVVRYRLGDQAATRRARAATTLRAVASLAPLVFALVLLMKLGWRPPAALWGVAVALVVLVVVRAGVAYAAARRRLRALVVAVTDDEIRGEAADGAIAIAIARGAVVRITEIEGPLGGLRVQSARDPTTGTATVLSVPRGGEAFRDVRARLEAWRPIERRGRRAPAVRFALGAVVVVGIFFVPFFLDDVVARSKLTAAGLVVGMWLVMRGVLRRG